MTTSILTGLEDCPLHRRTPFGMTNVSHTQLSLARLYGAINYNGDRYIYSPPTDELIRGDVLAWKAKREKAAKKQAEKPTETTPELPL